VEESPVPAGTPAAEPFGKVEPAWVGPMLADIERGLAKWPPKHPPSEQRKQVLMALDGALHPIHAPRWPSVRHFYAGRIERAIERMESTTVDAGARIWRLYNMGFVVRTPSATIGFDIRRGWDYGRDWSFEGISDAWLDRLAEQLDALFISHAHLDHVDRGLAQRMLSRGRPVIVPPNVFTKLTHNSIVRPERLAADAPAVHALRKLTLAQGRAVRYVPYPGHQGRLENNVYLVRTGEGLTFMHTGDQYSRRDWIWIDQVAHHHIVDVLLVNCWTNDINRLYAGVRPVWVLTGHEAELGHKPIKRETFFRSYKLARTSGDAKLHVLCWGEGLGYQRGRSGLP
jgi:L-ascorbate metabolism protein UlaG (beta-lactamase superfamily)